MEVRFQVRVTLPDGSTGWRTFTAAIEIPPHAQAMRSREFLDWLRSEVEDYVDSDFASFGEYDRDGLPYLYRHPRTHEPEVAIEAYRRVLDYDDIYRTMARGGDGGSGRSATASSSVRMGRWDYHRNMRAFGDIHHRAFRYHIEGVNVQTLMELIPPELEMEHYGGRCDDRMCMYRMLRDRNPPRGRNQYKIFDAENLYQWFADRANQLKYQFEPVGSMTDGLTPDHVQAHARHFKYHHAALDITRGIVVLHNPSRDERNSNFNTIAYTIIGNHVIPFTDPTVIESIMNSASHRIGKRRFTGYASMHGTHSEGADARSRSAQPGYCHGGRSRSPTMAELHKRSRSLDSIFQADPYSSLGEQREREWSDGLPIGMDVEFEDRVEEFSDSGRSDQVSVSPPSSRRRNGGPIPFQYPMAQDDDRFHCFTKAEGKAFIRERLRPSYQEGTQAHLLHYFVCTDQTNIEFLYDYCIHVLAWDPTTTARSYQGQCHSLRIKNVIWVACPDLDVLRKLHAHLHPKEPLRLTGMATYAWRMLFQEMGKVGRYGTNLWDCMSQYPPNLQRLLDNHHPYHRPMLLARTYHAPYGNPYDASSSRAAEPPVRTIPLTTPGMNEAYENPLQIPEYIPMEERHRVDLIRSYTATLLRMADDRDEYPIHDLTNQLVPFEPSVHLAPPNATLPIGHYLVDLPTKVQREARGVRELWERLPCFHSDGEPRMMSHRMVKAMLDRGLIVTADIRLVCATAPSRQRRFGAALVTGLLNLVHRVYRMDILQDVRDRTVKTLVNQLIGVCNGTTVPYTGSRFVFRNLEEAYQLMLKVYSDDQLTRCRLSRCAGRDSYWDNREFFHYELSTGGYTNKPFHLQPVYNMVLEDQAIRMFDVTKHIPLNNLIQLKIDAVEYRVRPQERSQTWVQRMIADTVDPTTITENRLFLENGWIGRYKSEAVKGPEKWYAYHQKETGSTVSTRLNRLRRGDTDNEDRRYDVEDPETLDYVADWKETLTVVQPGLQVREPNFARDHWVEWFRVHAEDRIGVLLTGPAGTGKTHLLKACYDTALALGKRVVRSSFTHAACVQLGFDAVTLSHLFGLDARDNHRSTMVLSRAFAARLRTMQLDLLMIDEISMLPLDILECLMLFHRTNSQTRIILSGDFNQLPPVESYGFDTVWSPHQAGRDVNYFDQTDIFPYLTYDRVNNLSGEWIQLTECMRTDDPLLQAICLDPSYVVTRLEPQQFPAKPNVPMWRFLCHTNLTRKACNWYCMVRWCEVHPDAVRYDFQLRDVYVQHHLAQNRSRGVTRFDAHYYEAQYDQMIQSLYQKRTASNPEQAHTTSVPDKDVVVHRYVPRHWQYLQSFTYGVGMEVVSRNTLQSKAQNTSVVNNRRAVIQALDTEQRTVTLQWMDVLVRQRSRATDDVTADEMAVVVEPEAEAPLVLTFYDFAFNFVPGFCTTCHLAQGETIREHYGILDWNHIRKDVKMAYVAVTRASHPDFLHICANFFADPWESRGNADVSTNVLRKLYHLWKTDYGKALPLEYLPLDIHRDWTQEALSSSTTFCDECRGPVKWRSYLDNDLTQFNFLVRFPYAAHVPAPFASLDAAWSSVGDPANLSLPPLHQRVLRCVCKTCHNAHWDRGLTRIASPIPVVVSSPDTEV